MKKRIAMVLACALALTMFSSCGKSGSGNAEKVDYDPKKEIAKYKLPDIPEKDKGFKIQMGYNNCDHMVGAIIGEETGIYKALDLDVTVTKTSNTNIAQAMTTGEMHVGYMGVEGAIRAKNQGAPITVGAANHLGGSSYLVVSNEIKDAKDLIGKKIAVGKDLDRNPEWVSWSKKLGLSMNPSDYEIVEMAQKDAPLAMQTKKIDAFTCCDPFASQCEFQGIGRVMAIGWGKDEGAKTDNKWGLCCMYGMNANFKKEHPELAERLIVAHALAIKYIYEHPYNAAMMFADGFGTAPEVGLMTIYMKTVAEGRTITWQFSKENFDNFIGKYKTANVKSEFIPVIENPKEFIDFDLLKNAGVEDFDEFIKEAEIDEKFPKGIKFKEWLEKAKKIDGIDKKIGDDIKIPAIYEEK